MNRLRAARPETRCFWLLLTSGLRTYRFLPVFWKNFYPRRGVPTPPDTQRLLAHLARLRYGACSDAVGGLVRFPHAQRLRDLLSELARIGALDLHVIWPQMRLVSCWGMGGRLLLHPTCKSGCRSRPSSPRDCWRPRRLFQFLSGHVTRWRSPRIFFEFEDERGAIRQAHELHSGQRYQVIVTTGGGLWRYRLGDCIEVDGFVEKTPSIRFNGRGGGVSDVYGEKLVEAFVTQALHPACEPFEFTPAFAMVAPEVEAGGRPRYVLFVEGMPPARLADRLDHDLRQNPHYALCRDLGQLGPSNCFAIPDGAANEIFCRVQVPEGHQLGDIKPQSLSARTDWRRQFTGEL